MTVTVDIEIEDDVRVEIVIDLSSND